MTIGQWFIYGVKSALVVDMVTLGMFLVIIIYRVFIESPASPDWSSASKNANVANLKRFTVLIAMVGVAFILA